MFDFNSVQCYNLQTNKTGLIKKITYLINLTKSNKLKWFVSFKKLYYSLMLSPMNNPKGERILES